MGARGDDARVDSDSHALAMAAQYGALRTLELLLRPAAGGPVDVDAETSETGMTALWTACDHGYWPAAELLIRAGANVDARKRLPKGTPCLGVAVQNGHAATAFLLLRRGADPNAQSAGGANAVGTAALCGCLDPKKKGLEKPLVALLLRHGGTLAEEVTDQVVRNLDDGSLMRCPDDVRRLARDARDFVSDDALLAALVEAERPDEFRERAAAAGNASSAARTMADEWAGDGPRSPRQHLAAALQLAFQATLRRRDAAGMERLAALGAFVSDPAQWTHAAAAAHCDAALAGAGASLAVAAHFVKVRCLERVDDYAPGPPLAALRDALALRGDPALDATARAALRVLDADTPRLVEARYGAPGSDGRVVVLRRRALYEKEATPPDLVGAAVAAAPGGVVYRLFGCPLCSDASERDAHLVRAVNCVWRFDAGRGAWAEVATSGAAPRPRQDAAACYRPATNAVVVWGGDLRAARQGPSVTEGGVHELSLDTLAWRRLDAPGAKAPKARMGHRMVIVDDALYVVGGQTAHCRSVYESSVVLHCRLSTGAWSKIRAPGPCTGTLDAACWYEPPSAAAAKGRVMVFGGQIWPGAPDSSTVLVRGRGVQTCRAFHAFDVAAKAWAALPLLGDAPPPIQEATVVPLDGGARCVVAGGYTERSGASLEDLAAQYKQFEGATHAAPYRRGFHAYDSATGCWVELARLGDDVPLVAQAWAAATSTSTFVVGGGYGVGLDNDAPVMSGGEAGTKPVAFKSYYECQVHDEADGLSTDAWGQYGITTAVLPIYHEGGDMRSLVASGKVHMSLPIFGPIPESNGQLEREAKSAPRVPPELRGDPFEMAQRVYRGGVYCSWVIMHPSGDRNACVNMDNYKGPFLVTIRDDLLAKGWDRKSLMIAPPADMGLKGRCFAPPGPNVTINQPLDPILRRAARAARDAEPRAAAFAERLGAAAYDGDATFTIKVEVVGLYPPIWRRLRVAAGLPLSDLDDRVLRPAFGYTRNMHAHAFRRRPHEPWLGPRESTAMDMCHLPWYVRALGPDAAVRLGQVLADVGDELTWVWDLGDWWEHRVTVEAVGRRAAGGGGDDVVAALLGGEGAGVPEDCGGPQHFASQVNRLVGAADDASNASVKDKERRIIPGSEAFWKLLNEEFRKKNCARVVYDPRRFDRDDARAAIAAALRSRRSRPQHADRNFTTTSASGLMGPIGGDAAAPGDRAQRKKFCAVCGVRANLQACARCGNAFYCSKAHQESHWKEHRRDCKKARAGGK